MTKRLAILIFLLGSSFVLSQELFYEPFVVPRLASLQEVPFLWWFVAFVPEIIVCVGAGMVCKYTKEWLLFCMFGGLVVASLQWIAGFLNQPAHVKAIEGGFMHFAIQCFILFVVLSSLVGTVRLVRFWLRFYAHGEKEWY